MARTQLRFGIEAGTVQRATENLRDQAHAKALDVAERSRHLMEEAVIEVSEFYGLDPSLYDGNIEVVVEDSADGPTVYTRLAGGVDENHEIAIAVREWGRKSYTIYPATRKVLKFELGGEDIYSRRARIRASPAYNILRRARDRAYQRMRRGTV